MSRGHRLRVYHSKYGTVATLVCYDAEFPEATRVLAEAGTETLFVPSCTDDRQGDCRVRYCAQARAIENQMTPSDYHFARDGLAAEGTWNQEQMIVAATSTSIASTSSTCAVRSFPWRISPAMPMTASSTTPIRPRARRTEGGGSLTRRGSGGSGPILAPP